MTYPLAALQLRPSPFDPVGTLQVAANLGQAQANSELAKLRMEELRAESAESQERRGALGQFRQAGGMNNPAALSHLAGHPDVFTPVQTAMTAQQTIAREANARAAQRVASLPEGSRERSDAWQEELENARREGRMSPEAYQRYAAYQHPPQLLLQGIIQQGRALPTAAELQRQRIYDEMFGPDQPAATPSTALAGPAANTAPGTPRVTVDSAAAPQFAGLFRDLQQSGVAIDPAQTGGYNPRNIAGTNTPSMHASGRAVDVNWRDNPEGSLPLLPRGNEPFNPNNLVDAAGDRPGQTEIPSEVARALARKNGLRWGGDFRGRSPDPMHFEVAGAPPVAGRAFTTIAGAQPPAAAPATTPTPAPAVTANAPPAQMGLRERVASFTREQRQQIQVLMAENKIEDALKLIREFSGDNKPPPGFERDPNNPGGLRATAGGPAEHLPSETAARMAFLETAMRRLPSVRQAFERAWSNGDIMRNMAAGGADNSGRRDIPALSGDIGQARRDVRMIVEGALRAQTGAAAPDSEVDRYAAMFVPGATDSIESARRKLDALDEFSQRYRSMALSGRTANPASLAVTPPAATAPPPANPPPAAGYRVLGVR